MATAGPESGVCSETHGDRRGRRGARSAAHLAARDRRAVAFGCLRPPLPWRRPPALPEAAAADPRNPPSPPDAGRHRMENTMTLYTDRHDVPASYWRWKNFSPTESACRGTGRLLINERTLDALHALCDRLGKPPILRCA